MSAAAPAPLPIAPLAGSTPAPQPPPRSKETIAGVAKSCADEPLNTKSTIHYVCDCGPGADRDCAPGNDANDGTKPSSPLRTYPRALSTFESLAAGDTLAFCKGGSFDASAGGTWVNTKCRAGTPCVVRDYNPPWASGDEGAPKLVSTADLLSLANGGDAEHEEGYRFLNLELDGAKKSTGVFVFNDVTDVTLCNVTIDGFAIAMNIQGSNNPQPGSDARNARISLRGSRIINNTNQGFLGACSDCVVEYNLFDKNGSDGSMFNHSIYLSGASDHKGAYAAKNMRVAGNEIYRSSQKNGVCAGVPFVVHGQKEGLLIEDNTVKQDIGAATEGCWGIAVDVGGYSGPEFFDRVTVRNNRVINAGSPSIGVTSCSNCVIENNLVIQGQSFRATGIVAPDKDRNPAKGDRPLDAVTIRNNVVYFASTSGGTGIQLGKEGTRHVIVNNAILSAATSNWSCFDLNLAPTAYYSDHNLCWAPAARGGKWEANRGALSAWRSTGLDVSSLSQDPKFKKPGVTDFDFAPDLGSPLIDAGDPKHFTPTDVTGKPRPTPPDIGAFQH